MDNPIILVVDSDPKNLQILQEGLESSGFSVITASDGQDAFEKIHTEHPDLVLSEVSLPNLDGFQLLEKLKQDPSTSSIPMTFLTNRREIQDRVRSLRGGVKDYMIKPLHVKEVIARIRMILRRLERVKNEDIEPKKKLVGRLEEYNLADLIENFGVERKSGVLTVYNENNRNGEIYFRNGAVVHASLGLLKAEKAVYQMLPWRRGHFIMIFKEIEVPDSISVSNLGLLLHGFKRMEERERLFKMLPSPETTFVLTSAFRKILAKKDLSTDAAKFLALIDGRRDIMQIIDQSTYEDLKTLERLVKLYQQGFIKPGRVTEAGPAEIKVANLGDESGRKSKRIQKTAKKKPALKHAGNGSSNLVELAEWNDLQSKPEPFDHPQAQSDENEQDIDLHEIREPEIHFSKSTEDVATEKKDKLPIEKGEAELHNVPEETDFEIEKQDSDPTISFDSSSDALNIDNSITEREIFELAYQEPVNKNLPPGEGKKQRVSLEVPEPLSVPELRPNLDILEALAKFQISEKAAPNVVDSSSEAVRLQDAKAEPAPSPERQAEDTEAILPEVENLKAEKAVPPGRNQEETAEAFPLRSYGSPNATDATRENQAEEDEIQGAETPEAQWAANENVDTPPEKSLLALGKPAEIEEASAKQGDYGRPGSIEKRIKKLPERQLPGFAEKESSFTDLDHLFPAGKTADETALSDSFAKPDTMMSDRLTNLLNRLAVSATAPPAKLVLIGAKIEYIERFAAFILDNAPMKKFQSKIFEYLGVSERQTIQQNSLVVVGVSMEQQFTQLLDSLADGFAGYVLLIEATSRENLDYISYLHSALKDNYRRPFGIAVVNSSGGRNLAVETIRDLIGADKLDLIQTIDLDDKMSMLQFIQAMLADQNLQRWQENLAKPVEH